ncbi:MAG TPA: hypothetical protein VLD59_19570 [Steroidobacteraceae bacterium]|nr:hypothetical protein [Steroidobacteraceae bacterium]
MPVPIVVTRWGGRMTIEGVQVTQEDADVSAFQIGQQVVLLLAYNKEETEVPADIASFGSLRRH